MVDFIEYIVGELKSKRLSRTDAAALVKEFSVRPAKPATGAGTVLHPLLHANTSDLHGQSYASTFTGDEFFLADHRLNAGQKVLPGVAYLEMARAAIADAAPVPLEGTVLELRNTVWAQPIVVAGRRKVRVALIAAGEDEIEYEVYSHDGDEEIVHCQGRAVFERQSPPATVNLEELGRQMTEGTLAPESIYAVCTQMGLVYGPSMQSIVGIRRGNGQLLAQLKVPGAAAESGYVLHPSLLDGALQAAVGLFDTSSGNPRLPFALEALRIVSPCKGEMVAWVRLAPGTDAGSAVPKLDIDLCDERGTVCAQLRGMSWRELTQRADTGTFMAVPVWEASAASAGSLQFAEHHVVVCEPAPDQNIAERYTAYAITCFERIQSGLQSNTSGTVLFQIVVRDHEEQALLAGLTGLLRTASLESPRFIGQLILVPPGTSSEQMTAYAQDESTRALEPLVRYRDGVRQVLHWQEVPAEVETAPVAFHEGHVYLVTGGMGGLGTLFANEILARTRDAKVVLTGRADRSESRERIAYRSADVADLRQVEELISWIKAEYGRLDGILHCAGVIADDFIVRKPVDRFTSVLAPKVTGTFNLDYATRNEALDFLVLFSAIGGATGNVGQADYAAANAFMDRFAAWRNAQVAAGQRRGRTRSINWPLWHDGGMRLDAATQDRVQQATGMRAMDTAAGLRAFHRALALPHDQTLVVDGDLARLRRTFSSPAALPVRVQEQSAVDPAIDPDHFAEAVQDWLRKQFSGALKVPAQQIDPRAALEHYGIDSIVAMNLTTGLEATFGSLPKTLFFEYQTIRDLAGYFIAHHTSKSAAVCTPERKLPGDDVAPAVHAPVAAPAKLVSGRRFLRSRSAAPAAHRDGEPIAIVGLSGRYPEAVDIEAYWRNLRDGRDCITEVPKERWDWREYFSDDRTKSGHHYSKWGGFITGVDEFDPLFFNISPVEAELMDPQERLFLQHAWMAIEDAGYTRADLQMPDAHDLPGQVGVYVGLMYTEYQMLGAAALVRGKRIGVASSAGSIANRVSYLLNVHGPSMTLDTMCSSSLTAIHLACQDLKQGRTNLALAGGVNVSIHPNKYFVLSGGQFISGDGHCQSFGEGGDGYIPGEGVGVAVLKRLSDAERDGDHIYGVIRGSALNHGGKTNGYTVPNPQAQASVIRRALVDAGVDARRISYIEAHGTGTKLGDPIEIAALTKAFGTQDTGFCRIGSAKSNVGHCESAAGIAGLTKVLLQMQHRQIVPSLHSAQLNPHIDFERTPFVVNQSLRPWEQPVIDGHPIPRIAGISSFGAGGSNAHMVIEEYQPAVSPVAVTEVVIVLSARTPEQLQQRASDLLDFVRARQSTIDLAAMAYTLQVGREAMDERLGFTVTSVEELVAKLEAYVAGEQSIDGLHQGQVRRNREALALFTTDADLQQAVAKWIANRKTAKLLELWVKGLEVDWTRFYGETKPRRTSLPVYPFAKERYWVDAGTGTLANSAATSVLHPLLHANTSDLIEQRYSSTFTGEEFFLADHQVQTNGRAVKVLPGVASLEMARAAIERALPAPPDSAVLELRNTAWSQPIVVSGKTAVDIALIAADDDEVDFEIYSGEGELVHCQGRAAWKSQSAAPRLDLGQLRERMSRGALDAGRVYAASSRMGLAYGPSFRAITSLLRGDGEVLAELRLPDTASAGDYILHPSLMDGALQAAIGLLDDENEAVALRLPFALDLLRVLWPCSAEMVAWVRLAPETQPGDAVVRLEIDLCDARGIVCVELRGLALRALPALTAVPVFDEQLRAATSSLFAAPVWRSEAAAATDTVYAEQHVMVLQAGTQKNIAEQYTDYAVACLERIQDIFARKPEGKVLLQLVVDDDGEQRLFAGLAALLRTARLESSQFVGQLLLVPPGMATEELLSEEAKRPSETVVRYRDGVRQVLRWEEVAAAQAPIAWKDDGVYLITGGAGGLGLLFAREILDRTRHARVILTGRSERELPIRDARLSYRQADLGDANQVQQLIASIGDEYGRLDGILHSAGLVADHLLVRKTPEELRGVLAPKVSGAFHLDEATKDIELDFLILFSSLAGAMGNVGQGDYATANAFLDEFAAHRNRLAAARQRHGRTRSINWPLWELGGMQVDAAGRELMERTAGIRPLQTDTGLDALHRTLAAPHDQLLVAEGDVARMRRVLLAGPTQPSAPAPQTAAVSAELVEKTQDFLRREFSQVLKLPAHRMDAQAPLENYGIDSVQAMRLTNQLEQTFGSLSKTLFFEYQTIAALAAYLAKAHAALLQEKFGAPVTIAAKNVEHDPAPVPARRRKRAAAAKRNRGSEVEIAIVGLAGRYPQAENIQAFWRNLRNGVDSITEIPADRWDHARYFDADQGQPGKTYGKWGGFIADVDKFDPLFFNISPKEAAITDPQERLFLQTAWECLEDAGYTKESISGSRTGVFVGAMWGHYELFGAEATAKGEPVIPISSHSSIANRVSYFFDLHGPSIALDTMCSSSLTAIHFACEELRKGTIGAAIAGGANLTVHPYKYLTLSQGKFIASDGRCRSFGAGGDGYVPGEGVGAVLLKRLDDALRDGDQIYAVVRSSTLNHGGKTNGYTVPNPVAQGDLIVEALRQGNIDPKTLGYVETHGTGTSLGDPIEIAGLLKAFEGVTGEKFLPIGSVKSNIGHLESAAGIAAVTKALLQIRHKELVPSLHATPANPNIDFANSPFYVQTERTEWPTKAAQPRRVAVSSFGAGGSNAHLILEEYPREREVPADAAATVPELVLLSAKNADALQRYAERIVRFLAEEPNVSLRDLAYTSQVGRTPMDARLAIVTSTLDDLARKLTGWLEVSRSGGDVSELENVFHGNAKEAAFRASGVIAGEAGKAFLRDLLTRRDLEKLGSLWTFGVDADWSLMARPAKAARVSLPTYPFAKERCWIPQSPSARTIETAKIAVPEPREEKRALYYSPQWTATPLAQREGSAGIAPVLVLDETDRLFLAMREQHGEDSVVWVRPGDTFGEVEPNVYVVDPECEEHFRELVASLEEKALLPALIVHHAPDPCELTVRADVARELNATLYSLLFLCKGMLPRKQQAPPRIVALFASEADATPPLGAAVGGFLRTLTLEDPRYLTKAIEIPCELSGNETADLLYGELRERDWTTGEIRYRRQDASLDLSRSVRGLKARPADPAPVAELPLRRNGVYLLTGGLGGLGLIFARHLATSLQAKLVLVGRSAPNAAQQEQLAELEAAGAEVMCVQGDVSRLADMERAVRETKARFSQLHGVIHAAGVNRDAFILRKTKEQIEAVLAPKIHGAINVDLATRDENLDLFVIFSSLAGVLGNVGQADYAYANRFLDAFADRREGARAAGQRSGRTLSIDWPLWEAGGMSLSQDEIALLEKRSGIAPLPARDGIRVWEDLLRSDATQAVALYGSPSRIASYVAPKPVSPPRMPAPAADGPTLVARTEGYVKELIGGEIGLAPERIDSSDRLDSFGIDSLMINRLNARLESDLGALPKTLFYEHETVGDVARFLVRQSREALASLFGSADVPAEDVVEAEAIRLDAPPEAPGADDEIAIIGVHVRFPHSPTLDTFWENLSAGRDLIDVVPRDRWDADALHDPDPAAASAGKIYCKWGGFLDDHDKFDPRFFQISGPEAKLMDPQERLFLQSVWSAIEDAGYTRDRLKAHHAKGQSANVGVFVGVTTNSYQLVASDEAARGNFVTASAMPWSIANRVSYFFDFNGPSTPVDAACSSSLVAIHLACESLKKRECGLAIAGGVNLYLHPSKYQALCQKRALSMDDKCRSYGAGGEGFVPGEGVGTLVLKPLKKAKADGDRIYAVIRGSASEHSGRSHSYSVPNPSAQAGLIARTLEQAGVEPESIGTIEGHGTGGQMGDAVELAALTQAFRKRTEKNQFCSIGSVKANIGHTESAAGIAAVAKVVLQMQHRQLAPTIHSDDPNPDISFSDSPFYLQHGLSKWNTSGPRRALLHSFGAGGVNACLVVEEYESEPRDAGVQAAGPYVFTLSARNEERLHEYVDDMLATLRRQPPIALASLCYTLQTGREAMEERLAAVVSNVDQLIERLVEWRTEGSAVTVHRGTVALRRGAKREVAAAAPGAGDQVLNGLASRWASGEEVDWPSLYSRAPRLATLPTYPFARERYWATDTPSLAKVAVGHARLHPLIGYNSSTLQEVSFSSTLSPDAFYAVDHKVHGESIFPGAGFLEMACVSAMIAGEQRVRKLTGIVWASPLSFRAGAPMLRTALRRNGDAIEFEISSLDGENEKLVHSEGNLLLGRGAVPQAEGEDRMVLEALKERSAKSGDRVALYDAFGAYGLQYGPSFRTVQELYVNGSFALAHLKLPEHLQVEFGEFVLHPAIIDGALQTVAGLAASGDATKVHLPFALDEIELLRPVPRSCYAYVERADAQQGHGGVAKFNIRILSESGDVLVRMNNLYVRPFGLAVAEKRSVVTPPPPDWPALDGVVGESIN